MALILPGVVCVAFAVGGCAATVKPPAPTELVASPPPTSSPPTSSPSAGIETTGPDVAGSASPAPSGVGPLAVIRPGSGMDTGTQQVGFVNADGTFVSAGDGTRVVVGGGGDSNAESGTMSEAWLSRMPWVKRPSDSCPLASRWIVGGLARPAS